MRNEKPKNGWTFELQILATTDLHMRLLPFDYLNDKPDSSGDLASLASLIEALRRERPNTLLVDNGDFLQGTPMADLAADDFATGALAIHPAVAAMNAAGYDAGAIGNHEFDYGLPLLRTAIARAKFPFLATNLQIADSERNYPSNLMREVILERRLRGPAGQERDLRIGVIGLTPPRTMPEGVVAEDMATAATAAVRRLRLDGADIVLALCHSGMAATGASETDDLLRVAAIEGIDAVIGGHTHQPFPDPQIASPPEVDAMTGHIVGKPVVAPDAFGRQLGRILLSLRRDDKRWSIASSRVDLLPLGSWRSVAHPAVAKSLGVTHHATRIACDQIVGSALAPLQSQTPLIGPDSCLALLARAQERSVAARLAGSPWADLPLLSAVAPRQSPIVFPTGDIRRRQVFELAPFPDRCCALIATGAQVRRWLSRAASVFLPIRPGVRLQPLIDPGVPNYTFDILYGLTYRIDLRLGEPRIADLRYRGIEVADEDTFAVALSSHQIGEGRLDIFKDCPSVCDDGDLLSTAILSYLSEGPATADNPPVWSFVSLPETTAWFDAPDTILPQVPNNAPIRPIGHARGGMQRFEIDLVDRARHLAPAAD